MKIGVYDHYWETVGGGEQFAGGIAEVLARDHDVELLGPKPVDTELLRERLNVDVRATTFRPVANEQQVSEASADYDVFVNCTYLSFAPNRAPSSLYVVHFPNPPASRAQRSKQMAVTTAAKMLTKAPAIPSRIQRIASRHVAAPLPSERLQSYSRVVSNSTYTQGWVEKLWHVKSGVLYPPVRQPEVPVLPGEKTKTILSLGRFLLSKHGHSKKQRELIDAFRLLMDQPGTQEWRLVLIGGCAPQDREYAMEVKRAAVGLPIDIHFNATGELVRSSLRSASIYWHGAGLGEDPARDPDRFEHFGISVVEAMAHGAVPLVFAAAGPAETVGTAGEQFTSIEELAAKTSRLIHNDSEREQRAVQSIQRADDFGMRAFSERLLSHVNEITIGKSQ